MIQPSERRYVIAIAPNGARRTKADHAKLPMVAAELAVAAAEAREAGAAMVHLHVRDRDCGHVLDAGLYRDATKAVRAAVGDKMVVQITTEAVGRYGPEEQMAVVRDVRPEAVSLALRELCPTADDETEFAGFMQFMQREAIAPQIILYDASDVARLIDLVHRGVVPDATPDVLFVLGRYTEGQVSQPTDLLPFLTAAGSAFRSPMVCAFGAAEAACCTMSVLVGGDVRVGFENNLHLPDGTLAKSNADLVRAVAEPLVRLGHTPADAAILRERLARARA